eukprot:384138_1
MVFAFTIFSVICILFVESAILNPSKQWEEEFDHYTFMRPQDDYRLYWRIIEAQNENEEPQYVEIGIEAETTGWIGFGISDDGMMPNADIILGWIDDNDVPHLQRRHTTGRSTPIYDENIINNLIESEFDNSNE